jgi:hypothetical protein
MKNVNKTDPAVLVKVKDLFELKNFALSKIKIIKKPVTHTEILFYYSAYFYHFDSLVDFMKDRFSKNFTEKMEKSFGSNNREFLSKIRNSFTHHGEMISSAVHVGHDGVFYPICFEDAQKFDPPKTYLLEIIEFCEERIGKVILESLEEAQLFGNKIMNENEIKQANLQTINRIKDHPHVPDFVKNFAKTNFSYIDFNKVSSDQKNALKELLVKKS